ncbi:hypothetical protein [Thermococcus sp.]|uniref:hypothetical protein n=1 Tax=Thermococcus sp. TaxID=35749 RepID=UPI002626120C|nr:hypothetical protein [Thermococcus sp.]
MVRVRVENKWFEICLKEENHPYHNRQCDRNCPHWDLCMRGEFIEAEMVLIVDAGSLEELNKLTDELLKRGYKVVGKIEEG